MVPNSMAGFVKCIVTFGVPSPSTDREDFLSYGLNMGHLPVAKVPHLYTSDEAP